MSNPPNSIKSSSSESHHSFNLNTSSSNDSSNPAITSSSSSSSVVPTAHHSVRNLSPQVDPQPDVKPNPIESELEKKVTKTLEYLGIDKDRMDHILACFAKEESHPARSHKIIETTKMAATGVSHAGKVVSAAISLANLPVPGLSLFGAPFVIIDTAHQLVQKKRVDSCLTKVREIVKEYPESSEMKELGELIEGKLKVVRGPLVVKVIKNGIDVITSSKTIIVGALLLAGLIAGSATPYIAIAGVTTALIIFGVGVLATYRHRPHRLFAKLIDIKLHKDKLLLRYYKFQLRRAIKNAMNPSSTLTRLTKVKMSLFPRKYSLDLRPAQGQWRQKREIEAFDELVRRTEWDIKDKGREIRKANKKDFNEFWKPSQNSFSKKVKNRKDVKKIINESVEKVDLENIKKILNELGVQNVDSLDKEGCKKAFRKFVYARHRDIARDLHRLEINRSEASPAA